MGPAGEVMCQLVFRTVDRVLDAAAKAAYLALVEHGWAGAYAPCRPSESVGKDTMAVSREFAVNAGSSEAAVVRFQLLATLTMFGANTGQWDVSLQFRHILRGNDHAPMTSVLLYSLPATGRPAFGEDTLQKMQDRLRQSNFGDIAAWLNPGVQQALAQLEP